MGAGPPARLYFQLRFVSEIDGVKTGTKGGP